MTTTADIANLRLVNPSEESQDTTCADAAFMGVVDTIRSYEAGLDDQVIAATKLLASMVHARRAMGITYDRGHVEMSRIADSILQLFALRKTVIAVHGNVGKIASETRGDLLSPYETIKWNTGALQEEAEKIAA